MNCSQNIGHGVAIEIRRVDGKLYGVAYDHYSPFPEHELHTGWVPCKPAASDGWDVISEEPLTLAPSIMCRRCSFHGHIVNGRWEPA